MYLVISLGNRDTAGARAVDSHPATVLTFPAANHAQGRPVSESLSPMLSPTASRPTAPLRAASCCARCGQLLLFSAERSLLRRRRREKTKEAKKAAKELSDTLEANARMGMALLDAAAPEGALVLMELDLGEHRHRFPVVEGYLDKQKKKGAKLWQKRWFVLAGGRLDYHKSRKDATAGMAPLGTIWATNLLLVRILEGAEHAGTFSIEVYRDDKPDNPVRSVPWQLWWNSYR